MRSNETLHPGHKSLRLPYRDYAEAGIYFVTICSRSNVCIFGQVRDGTVVLNSLGELVGDSWKAIPAHFPGVKLHSSVVMPSHLHGLMELASGANQLSTEIRKRSFDSESIPKASLPAVIRSFKAIVARRAHKELGFAGEIWHRNYFERIIRSEKELANATQYIVENPMKWNVDRFNPEAAKIQ